MGRWRAVRLKKVWIAQKSQGKRQPRVVSMSRTGR